MATVMMKRRRTNVNRKEKKVGIQWKKGGGENFRKKRRNEREEGKPGDVQKKHKNMNKK